MQFRTKKRTRPKIHLTALIDIVFLLLVFFLLASSFIDQRGIAIILPTVESKSTELLSEVTISIDKNSLIYFNEVLVNEQILSSLLKKHFVKPDKQNISIHADQHVEYKRVVQVIDIAKLAGAKNLLLITEQQ